jgi:hypothetical protein
MAEPQGEDPPFEPKNILVTGSAGFMYVLLYPPHTLISSTRALSYFGSFTLRLLLLALLLLPPRVAMRTTCGALVSTRPTRTLRPGLS